MTSNKFASLFFEGDDDNALALILILGEARISATRALGHIDLQNPDTLSAYDYLMAQAAEQSKCPLSVAQHEGIFITTHVAGMFVLGALYNWDRAVSSFGGFETLLRTVWQPEETASGEFEAKLLDYAMAGVRAVAALTETGTVVPDLLVQAADNFSGLAVELEQAEHLETAFACACSATNFAKALGPLHAETPSNLALSLARRVATEDALAQLAGSHANLLAQIAKKDHNRRLDAFDAFESALWRLPSDSAARNSIAAMLEAWLMRERYLKPLRPLLHLALPPEERVEIPLNHDDIAIGPDPIWNGSLRECWDRRHYIGSVYAEIENARLALIPQPTEHEARAVWSSWSIKYGRLRHAVPHNYSIRREEFRDDILLELNHEITHVYSMFGSVGIATNAMRWALLELELDLWVWRYSLQQSRQELAEASFEEPAPLQEADVAALARAEQAIEVERKIQVLENTWAPWFEGIAVFGELAADPQMDPEWESPVGAVIYNLWDRSLQSEAQESGLSLTEVQARDRSEADALYGEAIRRSAPGHLRVYLEGEHRKYLAGYLAVRSVVSAWRSTLGTPIRGDEAFRILLHMTRFSGFDTVPDLGLSLEAFQEAAINRHTEWVSAAASASREDLDNILGRSGTESDPSTQFQWVKGRLVKGTLSDEEEQRERQDIVALATQCLSSLRGARADVGRVVDANDSCRAVMETLAEALESKGSEPKVFTPDNVARFVFRFSILPLGRVDCPFWLLEQDHYVACLIRTRERDREHGKPSYDLTLLPLEEAEYASLRERVLRSGARRMVVTRVVDLTHGLENRSNGTNFMVFQYQDWMHIQPRGALFGGTNVEPSLRNAVEDRLSPSPALAFQEWLTGEEHPCAHRTAQWIKANDWVVDIGDGSTVDVSPWAERVRAVADQVLSNSVVDVAAVSRRCLLDFVIGDPDVAALITEQGLSPLRREDVNVVKKLIRVLDASARSPVEDYPELETINETVETLGAPLLERTSNGWDVVRPRGIERRLS